MFKLSWKQRWFRIAGFGVHSDLSGKCWADILDEWLDAPRRLYLTTPLGSLTLSPYGDDDKLIFFQKR